MERLTINNNGCNEIIECGNELCEDICRINGDCKACPIKIAIDRLAAYEDTGLTPDQIQEIDKLYKEKCELVAFKDSIIEAYIKTIDTAVALTYELLNKYDIGLLVNTNLDLADKWTELIENGVLDEDELKGRLKAYFIEKARGYSLAEAEKFGGVSNG